MEIAVIATAILFPVLLTNMKLKLVSLLLAILYLHNKFCTIKALANLRPLFPHKRIKIRSECENYMVFNWLVFIDADNVLCSCVEKYFRGKLRVTSRHEHKVQSNAMFFHHLHQCLTIQILSQAIFVLEHQSISLLEFLLNLLLSEKR